MALSSAYLHNKGFDSKRGRGSGFGGGTDVGPRPVFCANTS